MLLVYKGKSLNRKLYYSSVEVIKHQFIVLIPETKSERLRWFVQTRESG